MIRKYTSCFLVLFSFVMLFSTLYSLERAWADSVVDKITVGGYPHEIAYNPSNEEMYVTLDSGNVSVIDRSNSVIKNITVGTEPYGIAYNPNNNDMYVANGGSNTVSVIDSSTNTVIDTISFRSSPYGIAYNPSNHDIYVGLQGASTPGANTVAVIDSSNSVVGSINVGDTRIKLHIIQIIMIYM